MLLLQRSYVPNDANLTTRFTLYVRVLAWHNPAAFSELYILTNTHCTTIDFSQIILIREICAFRTDVRLLPSTPATACDGMIRPCVFHTTNLVEMPPSIERRKIRNPSKQFTLPSRILLPQLPQPLFPPPLFPRHRPLPRQLFHQVLQVGPML